jgi:hypothetical protein
MRSFEYGQLTLLILYLIFLVKKLRHWRNAIAPQKMLSLVAIHKIGNYHYSM